MASFLPRANSFIISGCRSLWLLAHLNPIIRDHLFPHDLQYIDFFTTRGNFSSSRTPLSKHVDFGLKGIRGQADLPKGKYSVRVTVGKQSAETAKFALCHPKVLVVKPTPAVQFGKWVTRWKRTKYNIFKVIKRATRWRMVKSQVKWRQPLRIPLNDPKGAILFQLFQIASGTSTEGDYFASSNFVGLTETEHVAGPGSRQLTLGKSVISIKIIGLEKLQDDVPHGVLGLMTKEESSSNVEMRASVPRATTDLDAPRSNNKVDIFGVGESTGDMGKLDEQGGPPEPTIHDGNSLGTMLATTSQAASKLNTTPSLISRGQGAGETVLGAVQTGINAAVPLLTKFGAVMSVLDEVSKIHPYVKAAWTVFSAIPKLYLEELKQNECLLDLLDSLKDTFAFILEDQGLKDLGSQNPGIGKAIADLTDHTKECAFLIQAFASQSHLSRMKATVIAGAEGKIKDFDSTLKKFRDELTARLTQRAAINVQIAVKDTAFVGKKLGKKLDDLNQRIVLGDILYSDGVSYDSNKCCLPDTRVSLLRKIHAWVDTPDTNGTKKVLILTGLAGIGKSTVARSVCAYYDKLGRLGSSFFFNIRDPSPPGGGQVFSTIARDLADKYPLFRAKLAKIVEEDTSLRRTKQPRTQLTSFIVKPFKACTEPDAEMLVVGPVLVVIDALDECGAESKEDFIRSLANDLHSLPPNLRIVVTSRPEEVRDLLKNTNLVDTFDLGTIGETEAEGDMASFIQNRLLSAAAEFNFNGHRKDWLNELVKKSERLFIWAETACRQIIDPFSRTPLEVLDDILDHSGTGIDDLYLLALERALLKEKKALDPQSLLHFKSLMTRITILKMPLSVNELVFMQSRVKKGTDFPTDIPRLLSRLGAVLGGVLDPDGPVHLLHSSFRDFLLDKDRSKSFCIDDTAGVADAHYALANACAMVAVDFWSTTVKEPKSKFTSKQNCRPIAYSAIFWAYHLYYSGPSRNNLHSLEVDGKELRSFCSEYADLHEMTEVEGFPHLELHEEEFLMNFYTDQPLSRRISHHDDNALTCIRATSYIFCNLIRRLSLSESDIDTSGLRMFMDHVLGFFESYTSAMRDSILMLDSARSTIAECETLYQNILDGLSGEELRDTIHELFHMMRELGASGEKVLSLFDSLRRRIAIPYPLPELGFSDDLTSLVLRLLQDSTQKDLDSLQNCPEADNNFLLVLQTLQIMVHHLSSVHLFFLMAEVRSTHLENVTRRFREKINRFAIRLSQQDCRGIQDSYLQYQQAIAPILELDPSASKVHIR